LIISCSNNKGIQTPEKSIYTIQGNAQGTTYNIKYVFSQKIIQKNELDSMLNIIDMSMSSYIEDSNLSLINDNVTTRLDSLLEIVLLKSIDVCIQTEGSFDVTIAPLVQAYGFGPKNDSVYNYDSTNLIDCCDKLLLIGCDKLLINDGNIKKEKNVKIDVNGIAQGFSVDFLSNYLKTKEIDDFMIEIGGEVFCSGSKKGEKWILGISDPLGHPSNYLYKVPLCNQALATSGSTRKTNQIGDNIVTHIISPHTLFPIENNLLSVSVISSNCMDADAYATALMEMGLQKSRTFLTKNQIDIEVLFIYIDTDSGEREVFQTEGFNFL